VVSVDNATPPAPGAPSVDTEAIEASLRERLLASGLFDASARDGGAGAVTRVRVLVAAETVEVGEKGEGRAQVRVRAESRPSDAPGAVAFDLEGRAAQPYALPAPGKRLAQGGGGAASSRPALGPLALRVATDLVDGYVARRRLQEGPPEVVHAALTADGGELRDEAIRVAGERRLKDEAPQLLKLLGDPEETTRDAALGALIALGDRRAVTELTRTRSLRDRREMRKIIEAISILGGTEADEYLSFVAETHDDDEIRAAAATARARLARRADATPAR
jgi:hypothetical protein